MRKIASIIGMWNYPTNLGMLIINLHSLEVVLRTFLSIHDIGNEKTTKLAQSLRTLKMDQEVDENQFTNYDTLKTLINNYNNVVSSSYSYPELIIDNNLIKLRDALAHGRAFYLEQSLPYTTMLLLKFSNPNDNKMTRNVSILSIIDWGITQPAKPDLPQCRSKSEDGTNMTPRFLKR